MFSVVGAGGCTGSCFAAVSCHAGGSGARAGAGVTLCVPGREQSAWKHWKAAAHFTGCLDVEPEHIKHPAGNDQ